MLKAALARDHQRILDLFRQWDADHSGAVDREEFARGVRRAGFDARQADLDQIFDDLAWLGLELTAFRFYRDWG